MDSDRPPSHAPGYQRPGPVDPLSDPYAEKLPPTPSYPAPNPSPRPPVPSVSFMNQSAGFPPPYQQLGTVPYSTAPMQAPYGQYPMGTLPPPGAAYQGQMQLGQVPYSNYGQRYPNPPPMGWAPRPYGSRPQQQQTVFIGASPVVYQPVVISQSYARHYALGCVVFWCFGCLFGMIALILASLASSMARTDPRAARQYGRASLSVSLTGILVAVIVTVVVVTYVSNRVRTENCSYYSNGYCYG